MGRKKRHKFVSAFVLGLLAISLAIYEFRGELMIPSVTPSITRRELLTRHMMVPPNDISLAINHLQMLSPSISPLPGKAPHEPPGTMELAPTVQSAAPSVQPVSPAVQSPAPSIANRGLSSSHQTMPPVHSRGAPDQSPTTKVAPPPLVVPSPNVPTVAVPSSPPNTPIPTSSPVSSPPLVNPPPLVAPSPMILQHVLPPGQNSQPIEHAFSPTSFPSPNHENYSHHDVVASPPSKERLTHISKQNYSHVAPSPMVSQHVQSSHPKEHKFSPTSSPSPHPENYTNRNFVASPPPKERSTHISKPNSSHVEVQIASPPRVPAGLSPSSTKGAGIPNTPVALSPLGTPTRLSHSNSSRGRVAAPSISNDVTSHALPPNDSHDNRNATSPVSNSPIHHKERAQGPVSAPPKIISRHFSHHNNSHEANGPLISPATHKGKNATHILYKPRTSHAVSPTGSALPVIASSPAPAVPFHQRQGESSSSLAPSAPPVPPKNWRHKHHATHISAPVPSISPSPAHSANGEEEAPTPSSSPSPISSWSFPNIHHKHRGASHPPALAPIALPKTIRALPPPPPNQYCTPLSCADPYTNSPPGSPCMCVIPIKVGLHLSVSLYKFFNLVSALAQEIASGVKMKQSQVRIMGANAATEDPDKTVVLVDLVPLGEKFDNITALLVFDKFWHKEVYINPLNFGDYIVLYVIYPGLPPSPPVAPDGGMGNGNKGNPEHPLAADISKQRAKQKAGIIAVIVLSSVFALILFSGAAWFVIFKLRYGSHPPGHTPSSLTKASGTGAPFLTSQPSSITASFNSNMVTYKGTARTFTLFEMDRATNGFDESRLIGEGGFGRVYEGILEDGKRVAIKVLKRDDQQGSREFMAEVEMLSRLHHRNLICLIGICTQEHLRSLVYELVPNGSVESHLYGADKETGPLDWDARLKIALGAARALAYLHEDSSPRVIHRDFKSSNILLEHDFTPKVSDFGLARVALGEDNDHISTRVVGTFGYVAPEYAMTGHLLVKSDVYSYGVVLLELLTGRKPVDMFRPPGQENLVTWARPLLTNQEGLESIADPSLGTVPFDNLAKVAAIASMCVQPEVDQRPFMGEVVQALKLVCNVGNEHSKAASETDTSENATSTCLEMGVFGAASSSPRFERDGSGSFRVYLGSGPLKTGHEVRVWERGSSSEHGVASRFGMDLEGGKV